jgi:hypothetical protein
VFIHRAALAVAIAASSSSLSSVRLSQQLPNVVRQKSTLTVTGTIRHPPRSGEAALESKPSAAWRMLATTRIGKRGAFKLRWPVPVRAMVGPLPLRVVALDRAGEVVAKTETYDSAVGPPEQRCAPPVPPAVDIPVGSGWIVGGRYNEGGPYPGIYACDSQPYTVTATNSAGVVAATQTVAGGHSYTLVVPAGTYTLKSDFCRGTATVTAATQTKADTVCPVP